MMDYLKVVVIVLVCSTGDSIANAICSLIERFI